MEVFAQRLRQERKKADLTQEDVAKMLGVTKMTISQYETGKRNPDLETLKKLALIFRVPTDYLLGSPGHEVMELTAEEHDLVMAYRYMDDVARGMVTRLFEYIKAAKKED